MQGGKVVGAGLAAVALALLALVGSPGAQQAKPRPNIVVIMSDDQTLDSMRYMPKTLADVGQKGTTFTNTVVSYSLCCPSRAGYLTGQYAHNNGVLDNQPPHGGYSKLDHTNTLPVWLQRAGYHTTHIGKYLNGYSERANPSIPPGYDDWQGLTDPSTYWMYGYTINDNGTLRTYGTAPADYQTDVLAARAEETIFREAPKERPFFLTVTPLAPHMESKSPTFEGGPPRPAPRHVGAYADEPLPRPQSFNEPDTSDKPPFMREYPSLTREDIENITFSYRRRIRSLLAVDDLVERVVTALRKTGELDNTILVYTSDNGYFQGEHRIPFGKVLVYEPSIRIPLMVRGPGFAAQALAAAPASNLDLTATIVQAARATPGRVLDGRSLKTVAAGGAAFDRPQYNESGAPGVDFRYHQAIRTREWKYVEHSTGPRELYDLVNDPDEVSNRIDDPARVDLVRELAGRLAVLRQCRGAACITGRPVSPGDPPPPGTVTGPAPLRLSLRSARLRLDRRGRIGVRLSCSRRNEDPCVGILRIDARVRSAGRTRTTRLGKASFTLAIGASRTVRVRIGATGRRLLSRRSSTSVRVTAEVRDAVGELQTKQRTYRVRRP